MAVTFSGWNRKKEEIENTLNNHINNKENPHKVNYEQVEAITYGNGKLIPEGTDLNDLLEKGCYAGGSNYIVSTLKNSPTSEAFNLIVFSGTGLDNINSSYRYLIQKICTFLGKIYIRWCILNNDGVFDYSQWVQLFTTESGTLTDSLYIHGTTYPSIWISCDATTKKGIAELSDDGYFNLYNYLDQDNSLRLTLDFENKINKIYIHEKISGAAKTYTIFGEHNKPKGLYIGTGTSKTVNTDGAGDAILIYSNNTMCIATYDGCFYFTQDSGYKDYMQTNVTFRNGTLTLTDSSVYANSSGKPYNYQVL